MGQCSVLLNCSHHPGGECTALAVQHAGAVFNISPYLGRRWHFSHLATLLHAPEHPWVCGDACRAGRCLCAQLSQQTHG